METKTEGLKRVTYQESYGGNGNKCIIEIYVDAGREFTKEEKQAFNDARELISKAVSQASYALNKEYQRQGAEDTQKIIDLFKDHKIFVQRIPNEYWAGDVHNPWLIVTTPVGHIKLGWRKRVINIDWSSTIIEAKAEDLFPDEDVTKYDKSIHAWGYEKAQEYINKLLSFK